MSEPIPATPAKAATPGDNSNGNNPPSNVAPANSEGKVTITTKEFADLQRAAARGKTAQKRAALGGPAGGNNASVSTGDENADTLIKQANERAATAERTAFQMEVKDSVRELLAKPEYANIPQATKSLILKNPAGFSQASTLDEAILDIEEHLNEVAGDSNNGSGNSQPGKPAAPAAQPTGHEAPPANGGGSPTPVKGGDLEDTSKLKGAAKTQAMIRNSVRSAGKKA